MNEFTTIDIQRLLHVERQRLREWIDRGFVIPSVQRASGVGTKNIFNQWDVYGIEMFRLLIETGFNRSSAAQVYRSWWTEFRNYPIDYRHKLSIALMVHNLIPKQQNSDEMFDELCTYFVLKEELEDRGLEPVARENFPGLVRWEVFDLEHVIKSIDKKLG